jgi:hypothetical protein
MMVSLTLLYPPLQTEHLRKSTGFCLERGMKFARGAEPLLDTPIQPIELGFLIPPRLERGQG